MVFGTIYSYPGSFRVTRAIALAALNGLEVELSPGFEMYKTNAEGTPFRNKFPLGKVPALECKGEPGGQPVYIYEGLAIAFYLASKGPMAGQLLGRSSAEDQARVLQWCLFGENEIVANFLPVFLMTVMKSGAPFNEAEYDKAMQALKRALQHLENALATNENHVLVGSEFTMADVTIAAVVHFGCATVIDAELRAGKPATMAWLGRLLEVPEINKEFGELKLCESRPSLPLPQAVKLE